MTSRNRRTRESLSTRPMTIAIAVAAAIGGFILPFLGWIAAIVMMWLSPVWTTAAKIGVTIAPLAIGAFASWLGTSEIVAPGVAITLAVIGAVLPGLFLLLTQSRADA